MAYLRIWCNGRLIILYLFIWLLQRFIYKNKERLLYWLLFNNLTQEEIAENYKVSKNAVSKTLKEVKEKLDYYEEKLKLYHNKEKIKTLLSSSEFTKIEEYI